MSSSNCHAFHIPHPKWANPLGEKPWAYAMLISWQSCLAASALADLILTSSTSPDLQFTCGQSQQCLMTCCCLAFSELAVSVLFPRDGYLYSRKTKPVSGSTVGRLSRGNALPPCLPACLPASLQGAWQSCLCHLLSLGGVTHFQYKLSATGLISQQLHCFTRMEDPGQGNYRWVCESSDAAPFV